MYILNNQCFNQNIEHVWHLRKLPWALLHCLHSVHITLWTALCLSFSADFNANLIWFSPNIWTKWHGQMDTWNPSQFSWLGFNCIADQLSARDVRQALVLRQCFSVSPLVPMWKPNWLLWYTHEKEVFPQVRFCLFTVCSRDEPMWLTQL